MKELSQREAAFAVHFTTIGSDTFSDGKNSAIASGYSDRSAHVAASRLLKRDKVRNRISELHSENMQRNLITVDKVLADLEHDKILARKHDQYAVARGSQNTCQNPAYGMPEDEIVHSTNAKRL